MTDNDKFLLVFSDLSRLGEFQRIMRDRRQKQHFVLKDWASHSVQAGYLLPERTFGPKD